MFSIKHIALYMFIFDSLDLVEIRFWHMAAIYIYIYQQCQGLSAGIWGSISQRESIIYSESAGAGIILIICN